METSRSPIQKALHILEIVSRSSGPLRLVDLANATGMRPPTALRTIGELLRSGWLVRLDADRYTLGVVSMSLVYSPQQASVLRRHALPILTDLAIELNLLTNLQVLDAQGTRVVCAAKSPRYAMLRDLTGSTFPAHETVAGTLMVAHLPAPEQAPYLKAADLSGGLANFESALAQVSPGEVFSRPTQTGDILYALSAPVSAPSLGAPLALSVGVVREDISEVSVPTISAKLSEAARRLEVDLGLRI